MRNIYKSQKYQFFRDVKMYLLIFAFIVVMVFTIVLMYISQNIAIIIVNIV